LRKLKLNLKLLLGLFIIFILPSVFSVSADTFFIDSNNHNSYGSFEIESPTAVEYDGVWYVIYESDDYHFYLAKSFDDGETWSKQKLTRATYNLWPGWGQIRPSSLFIKDDVMYWVYPAATSYYSSWVSLEYSSDFGETWSSVNRLSFHDNGVHNNIVDDGDNLFVLEDDRAARYNTFDYTTKTSSGEVNLDCVVGQWEQISDVTKAGDNKYVLCRKSGGGTNLIEIDSDYNQTTNQVFTGTYDHYELVYDNNNTLSAVMKSGSEIYFSVYDSGTETFSDPLKISGSVQVSSRSTATVNQENDILVLFTDTNSELYLIYYDLDSNTWFAPTKVQGITNASNPKFSFHTPPNKIADDFQILINGDIYWGKFTSLDGLGVNYFLDITSPTSGEQILQRDSLWINFQVKDSNYNYSPAHEIQYKLDDSDEWTEKTITGYEQFFGFNVTAPDQTGEHTLTIRTLKNGEWIFNSVQYEIIPREIDLKVNFIKAIQVVEDVDLVAGKATAVKVGVTNENNTNQSLAITVRLEFNDKNFLETKTFVGDSNFIFYVDNPYEEEGEYGLTAEIDSNEKYTESNENNNYGNTIVTVKDVKTLELSYVPVDLDNNHYVYNIGGPLNNINYYIKNLDTYYEDIDRSNDFLFSSFPLRDVSVHMINKVYCIDSLCLIDINYQDDLQKKTILAGMEIDYLLAGLVSGLSGNEFRIVGITPENSVIGFTASNNSVLVDYPFISIVAHEIAHTIWYNGKHICDDYRDTSGDPDKYKCANQSLPDCNCITGNNCLGAIVDNGVWVDNKEEFRSFDADLCNWNNTFTFMGNADYRPPRRWINFEEYQHLFSAFEVPDGMQSSGSDINILLVSGMVDINLDVELNESYIIEGQEFGSSDGNCAVRTTDINGLALNDYNFSVSFIAETYPPEDSNYSSFILGIAFSEDINSVQVICNGELKAERFVSANAPTVSITSPSGGEQWSEENLIEWTANDADGDDLEFVIQYSDDTGLTWNPLGMHVTDENFTFDVGMVDGNTSYKIKIIATDGVLTAEDISATFTILNPDINVVPNELSLGAINNLQNVSQDFNIINSGNADLNVFDENHSENLTLTGLSLPIVLEPGEGHVFSVELEVLDMNLGEFVRDINLGSNDPNQIVKRIKIYGEIEEAKPDFKVTEDNISFNPSYPDENQTVTVNALVENVGDLNASDVNVSFYLSGGNEYIVDFNTVALYHFEEGTGTTAFDSSANNNEGDINGAEFSSDTNFSEYDLNFDSITDVVVVPDDNSLDIVDEVTIEAWVKPNGSQPNGTGIVCKGYGGGSEVYCIDIYSSKFRFFVRTPTAYVVSSTSSVIVGEWQHVAGTYDGTNIRIYVNKELENTAGAPASLVTNSHPLSIGNRAQSDGTYDLGFNGLIDEVRVSNIARTDFNGYEPIDEEIISFIDANSTELVSVEWNSVPAGNHNVFVVVDEKNLFDERDEENNQDFNSVTVYVEPELSVEFEYSPLNDLGELFDLNAIIENTGATLKSANANLILPEELTTTDSLTKTIGDLNSHTLTKIEWTDINSSEAGLFEIIVNVQGSNADENFSAFTPIMHIELSELDVNEFVYPDQNIGDFNVINFNPDVTYTEFYYNVDITGPENYSFDANVGSLYAGQTKNIVIEWDAWKQTGSYSITVSLYDFYDELIDQKQDSFEIVSYEPSLLSYYSTDGLTFDPEFSSYADYFSSASDEYLQVMLVYSYNGTLKHSIRTMILEEWSSPSTIGTGNYPYVVADGNTFHLVYVDGNVYYRKYSFGGWSSAELVSEMSSVDPVLTFDGSKLYALFSSEVNGLFNVFFSGFDGSWNEPIELTHCLDSNCSNPIVLDEGLVGGKLSYAYRKFKGEEYSTLDSNLMYSLFDVNYFYWGS